MNDSKLALRQAQGPVALEGRHFGEVAPLAEPAQGLEPDTTPFGSLGTACSRPVMRHTSSPFQRAQVRSSPVVAVRDVGKNATGINSFRPCLQSKVITVHLINVTSPCCIGKANVFENITVQLDAVRLEARYARELAER